MHKNLTRAGFAASALALVLATAACSSNDNKSSSSPSTSTSSSSVPAETPSTSPSARAASGGMVGPGCAAYAKANPSGAGSIDGMAAAPVATAASGNPLLKTLVAAVSGKLNPKVNLVSTLNGGEFTVFAPVDTAFAKIPAATVNTLKTNSALLTKILTYHVVAGQLDPTAVVGKHPTVEKQDLTVTGSGDTLKVNGANVICGGVKTANATVYLIDSVLMPPAA
ncbi:fasciclin domain-containing protein [Kribbella sp. NPDC059898]|uniref:fasciclin domain-containing protein n=1 Tax=Kribbella sp. NPDC059898 TaxID=3346995 RepID=UPI00364D2B80